MEKREIKNNVKDKSSLESLIPAGFRSMLCVCIYIVQWSFNKANSLPFVNLRYARSK